MAGFNSGVLTLDSSAFVTSSGDNNDVSVDSSLFYVVVSNDMDAITGLALGNNAGALILVVNVGPTNNLILKNNSGSSAPQNVIISSNGADYVVPPYNTAILGYDTTNLMWHIVRVPDSVPSGTIQMWGVVASPPNWLLCDGSSYLRSAYPALFGTIGTTFGSADSTHFNVPDFRQKFPLGKAASGTGSALAGTGGSIDHIHTADPPATTSSSDGAHTHSVVIPSENATVLLNLGQVGKDGTYTSSSDGAHTHSVDIASFNTGTNNPPFLAINYIIKI